MRLFEVRRQAEIVGGEDDEIAEPSGDPEWIESTLKDGQLAEAVRAVRAHIDDGSWPEADAEDTVAEVSSAELGQLERARNRILRDLARIDRRAQALRSGMAGDEAEITKDFWDDDIRVEGGQLIVRNEAGEIVATLRITGENLERWLLDADVEADTETDTNGGSDN